VQKKNEKKTNYYNFLEKPFLFSLSNSKKKKFPENEKKIDDKNLLYMHFSLSLFLVLLFFFLYAKDWVTSISLIKK